MAAGLRDAALAVPEPVLLKPGSGGSPHDRRVAECLQRLLLRTGPNHTMPGLCVEALHEAALPEATVGGDGCDAFALTGGRTALMVADAAGKGLAAAEGVAEIRFALRAFLQEHEDPGRALSCLNDFVCDAQRLGQRDDGAFATLTLAIVNNASGEMTCLCAGGEPPLVLRAGGAVETVQSGGMALGLRSGQKYEAASVCLDGGDTMLLFTDGLTEAGRLALGGPATTRPGAFLGLDGLVRLARQAWEPAASLRQISEAVFESVRHFSSGAFHDDVCLLAGRREAR